MATEPETHVASTLLHRAHVPETADSVFRERVKQRPLLLRPTSPDPSLNARSKRQYEHLQKTKARRKSNKPRPLSAKQKRKLGLYDVPREQQRYSIFEPIHRMWCAYMREILGLSDGKRTHVDPVSVGPMLVSADYHGALVEVVRSRCPSRVGAKGIVMKDTKFTFEIVTEKNGVKRMPKEHTVFRFQVPFEASAEKEAEVGGEEQGRKPLVFEIHGDQFQTRAPERANRKYKSHPPVDL